jgi:hypothetical protein
MGKQCRDLIGCEQVSLGEGFAMGLDGLDAGERAKARREPTLAGRRVEEGFDADCVFGGKISSTPCERGLERLQMRGINNRNRQVSVVIAPAFEVAGSFFVSAVGSMLDYPSKETL